MTCGFRGNFAHHCQPTEVMASSCWRSTADDPPTVPSGGGVNSQAGGKDPAAPADPRSTFSSGLPRTRQEFAMSDVQEPPRMIMRRYLQGFQCTQAVYVMAQLGLADLLADRPRACPELAAATGTHPEALARFLRLLEALDLLRQEEGVVALTPLGEQLRTGVTGSARNRAVFFGDIATWSAWGALLEAVRTGEPAYHHVFGMSTWEYRERHPDKAEIFNDVMTELTALSAPLVAKAYTFPPASTVVDVGGGHGELLTAMLSAHPDLRGVLFDLPDVVKNPVAPLASPPLVDRCELVGGDIFDELPVGFETYSLSRVVHDWDDAATVRILTGCREAMAPDGAVLLIERVIDPAGPPDLQAALSDLTMLVGTGGRERTSAEFRELLAEAGLVFDSVIPVMPPLSIIVARRP
jgi:hypothetical protein